MPRIKKRGGAAKRKKPEQEIRFLMDSLSDFAATHRKNLNRIGAALAVVLILFVGYKLVLHVQEQKAAPLAAAAYDLYRPASGAGPDYQKALDLFQEVQKKYSLTRSGARAQFYIGNCLMALGRNADALKAYRTFVSQYSGNTFLLGLVYERMGYAALALGKQSDAIKAFEQSDAIIGPGAATVELAKLYESSGDVVASQREYKRIADDLAGTVWAMEAMGKIQKISPTQAPPPAKTGK
jgi:tetratricopeptide (TPR) repeat protein